MNYEFRKKPIIIQAFQMTEERRNDNCDWPEWLNYAWNKNEGEQCAVLIDADDPTRQKLVIWTLEGVQRITWNDWIIQGVNGELYPCKPDIFDATYESCGIQSRELTPEEHTEERLKNVEIPDCERPANLETGEE